MPDEIEMPPLYQHSDGENERLRASDFLGAISAGSLTFGGLILLDEYVVNAGEAVRPGALGTSLALIASSVAALACDKMLKNRGH